MTTCKCATLQPLLATLRCICATFHFIRATFPKKSHHHRRLTLSELVVIKISCFHRQFSCSRADLVAFRLELVAFNSHLIALSHSLEFCVIPCKSVSDVSARHSPIESKTPPHYLYISQTNLNKTSTIFTEHY